jgi:hypothetical protein
LATTENDLPQYTGSMNRLSSNAPFSVYSANIPKGINQSMSTLLLQASDNFRNETPTGVYEAIACPPGQQWNRNTYSVPVYITLSHKATLDRLFRIANLFIEGYVGTGILPDIHTLNAGKQYSIERIDKVISAQVKQKGLVIYQSNLE